MANYHLTNNALKDLSGIWNYTYDTWSEKQADHYYNMLLGTCQKLADAPDVGRRYHEIFINLLGYTAGSHIIFYMKLQNSDIEVLRVLHSRMDIKNRMRQ